MPAWRAPAADEKWARLGARSDARPIHLEALETDEAAKVMHPLFLLAPRSMTTQTLEGSGCLLLAPQPRLFSKTPFDPAAAKTRQPYWSEPLTGVVGVGDDRRQPYER
jgi:hypothetical protein